MAGIDSGNSWIRGRTGESEHRASGSNGTESLPRERERLASSTPEVRPAVPEVRVSVHATSDDEPPIEDHIFHQYDEQTSANRGHKGWRRFFGWTALIAATIATAVGSAWALVSSIAAAEVPFTLGAFIAGALSTLLWPLAIALTIVVFVAGIGWLYFRKQANSSEVTFGHPAQQ